MNLMDLLYYFTGAQSSSSSQALNAITNYYNPLYAGPELPSAPSASEQAKDQAFKLMANVQLLRAAMYKIFLPEEPSSAQVRNRDAFTQRLEEHGFSLYQRDEDLKVLMESEEGEYEPLYTQSIFEELKACGLYIALLQKDGELFVVCRGTQNDPSVAQNIDLVQPGFGVIDMHKESIYQEIAKALGEGKKLTVIGHSLGGSVAAHITSIMMSRLEGMKVNLCAYQSAPLARLVAESLDEGARANDLTITDIRSTWDPVNLVQSASFSRIGAEYVRLLFNGFHPDLPLPNAGSAYGVPDEGLRPDELGAWFVSLRGQDVPDLWYQGYIASALDWIRAATPGPVGAALKKAILLNQSIAPVASAGLRMVSFASPGRVVSGALTPTAAALASKVAGLF